MSSTKAKKEQHMTSRAKLLFAVPSGFVITALTLTATLGALVRHKDNKEFAGTNQSRPGASVVKNRIGMELIRIPSGVFMMGSEKNADEKPVHRVSISKDFYMGKTEVTQGQWRAIIRTTVSEQRDKVLAAARLPLRPPLSNLVGEGDDYPMYYVSWEDAQEFIRKLNQTNDGYTYRLPTEAEWEYACRASKTGAEDARDFASMSWYRDNSDNQTHPVGTKRPDSFGLYDMRGNVDEWCEDWYHDNYNGAPANGTAWLTRGAQEIRVLRGGSWLGAVSDLRSTARNAGNPSGHDHFVGFRVVAVARH
jgi:formylglycine-generating enzyme required for sulfatase activity